MRIARARILEFHRLFDPAPWNPATVWRERRAPILVIEDEHGAFGLGEAWCRQDEIERSFAALADAVRPLIGRTLADARARLTPTLRDWPEAGAASAVDMALADLAARAADMPLARFLRLPDRPVAVYASGGLYGEGKDAAALGAEMASYVADGFRTVKMKIGGLGIDADLARVAAARAAIGDATLWVDGVERYDRPTATALARRLADLGVAAFQAPIPLADLDGLAAVARASPVPLVVGEGEWDGHRLATLLDRVPMGWLQVNAGLIGGPSATLDLARQASARGIRLTLQCHATAILQTASLHLGCDGAVDLVEFHRVHDHLHDLMPRSLRAPADGRLSIPPRPGLGIALPEGQARLVRDLRA